MKKLTNPICFCAFLFLLIPKVRFWDFWRPRVLSFANNSRNSKFKNENTAKNKSMFQFFQILDILLKEVSRCIFSSCQVFEAARWLGDAGLNGHVFHPTSNEVTHIHYQHHSRFVFRAMSLVMEDIGAGSQSKTELVASPAIELKRDLQNVEWQFRGLADRRVRVEAEFFHITFEEAFRSPHRNSQAVSAQEGSFGTKLNYPLAVNVVRSCVSVNQQVSCLATNNRRHWLHSLRPVPGFYLVVIRTLTWSSLRVRVIPYNSP